MRGQKGNYVWKCILTRYTLLISSQCIHILMPVCTPETNVTCQLYLIFKIRRKREEIQKKKKRTTAFFFPSTGNNKGRRRTKKNIP